MCSVVKRQGYGEGIAFIRFNFRSSNTISQVSAGYPSTLNERLLQVENTNKTNTILWYVGIFSLSFFSHSKPFY